MEPTSTLTCSIPLVAAPFAMVCVLMLGLVFLIRATMEEPPREPVPSPSSPPSAAHFNRKDKRWAQLRRWASLFRTPSLWLVYLQGIPGCVPWGVISAFLPDFLHADAGFSVREATLIVTAFTLGGLLGTHVGGQLGQALYNRSSQAPAALMFSAGALGIVPMWTLVMHAPSGVAGCALLAVFGGFFASQTGPNIRCVLCNVTQSDQRGLALAAFALADDVGKGVGPVAIAALVGRLGRKKAFAWSMVFWLPCAVLCGATALTVGADEARARAGQKDHSHSRFDCSSEFEDQQQRLLPL